MDTNKETDDRMPETYNVLAGGYQNKFIEMNLDTK